MKESNKQQIRAQKTVEKWRESKIPTFGNWNKKCVDVNTIGIESV